MNDFTNPDPYKTKSHASNCRDCGQVFIVNAQYDKNGVPVSFISKYCDECNMKPKITGHNGSWGTINIESAKIAQKNVEGLEDSLQTLATSIVNAKDEFGAFKKHAEYDIEQNANNIKKNTDNIMTNKINLDVFKSSQSEIDKAQIEFNNATLDLIKDIYKTLIIGFSVLVFFMLATWGYLTYTFLHK